MRIDKQVISFCHFFSMAIRKTDHLKKKKQNMLILLEDQNKFNMNFWLK